LTQAVSEHEDLMQAFRDMDPDAAARVWETHLRHTGETVANVLRDQADS
jgi:DNA-binding GntR family transcriptional regulator